MREASGESVCLLLGSTQRILVRSGSMVLIRSGERESYGAVIVSIKGNWVHLTFTPRGAARKVPLGTVIASVGEGADTLDLSSVPRFQPDPTSAPRRRRVQV